MSKRLGSKSGVSLNASKTVPPPRISISFGIVHDVLAGWCGGAGRAGGGGGGRHGRHARLHHRRDAAGDYPVFNISQSFLLSHTKRTGHSNQRGLLCRRLRPRWPRSRTPTARTETRCGQLGFKEKPLRIVWDPIETSPKSPLHFKGPIEILLKSPWTCIAGDGRCVQPHVHRQRRGEPRAGVPVRGAAGAAGTARRGAPTCPPQCGAVGVDAPTCAFL